MSSLQLNTLFTACALALACAMLSVIVVLRRWAFIGEGIAHSGFGGAGAAWILMLLIPAFKQSVWLPYVSVVIFCIGAALAIGALSRGRSIHADAAIGIFLTASLAFGILAQKIYDKVNHVRPALFDDLLYGEFSGSSPQLAQLAAAM